MKIDKDKLQGIIEESLNNVGSKTTPWLSETSLIGVVDGLQVQLTITSEEDDFICTGTSSDECLIK